MSQEESILFPNSSSIPSQKSSLFLKPNIDQSCERTNVEIGFSKCCFHSFPKFFLVFDAQQWPRKTFHQNLPCPWRIRVESSLQLNTFSLKPSEFHFTNWILYRHFSVSPSSSWNHHACLVPPISQITGLQSSKVAICRSEIATNQSAIDTNGRIDLWVSVGRIRSLIITPSNPSIEYIHADEKRADENTSSNIPKSSVQ